MNRWSCKQDELEPKWLRHLFILATMYVIVMMVSVDI